MGVSVTAPLGQAIARAKRIALRPFDLGKWFVLGFAAWLATLGEGGASFNYRSSHGGGPGSGADFLRPFWKLLQLVLRVAIAVLCVLLGCATCCIGFLPYLGTVITLPLHLFDRCYSVYFLEQFGPQYRLFGEIDAPPDASSFDPPPHPAGP